MNDRPLIIWFRYDLRLKDHPALWHAAKSRRPLIFVYIYDPQKNWSPGAASLWWLHHSLTSLTAALDKKRATLILKRGDACKVLQQLVEQTNAKAIYCLRHYDPFEISMEKQLHDEMGKRDVEVKRFSGYLLFEPEHIQTKTQSPFKVFTPFWRECSNQPEIRKPYSCPKQLNCAADKYRLASDAIVDWRLLPKTPDWAINFSDGWQPGELGAHDKLKNFLAHTINYYDHGRDIPCEKFTSRLSPHLHYGEISPQQIWHALQKLRNTINQKDRKCFLSELGWREFSHHLLFHWPNLPERPFKQKYADFPWIKDKKSLKNWQRGKTGIPLVDAGMRELWHTGWMHNRVRMVTASFLTKNLMISWMQGEAWFWDTLLDANLANNAASWQWVAGCGVDSAPYFRIFNPVCQSKKFDPEGIYIRRWVPELKGLNNKLIHEPWLAPESELLNAGIKLGEDYPKPIVDLKLSRERALAANASL